MAGASDCHQEDLDLTRAVFDDIARQLNLDTPTIERGGELIPSIINVNMDNDNDVRLVFTPGPTRSLAGGGAPA